MKKCECGKVKVRSEEEFKALTSRLKRIEGQIRGIEGMVLKNAYCIDILNQVAAASAALSAFSRELMASHIKGCVAEGVKNGDGQVLDELIGTIGKFMK